MTLLLGILAAATIVTGEDPALDVTSPADGLHTSDPVLHVNGTTAPSAIVRVRVANASEERWNSTISREDGTFDLLVDLMGGHQDLTVQAEDRAGNTTNVTRHVVLDVTGPQLDGHIQLLNGTRVPWNELLGGYVVREGQVVLEGTCGDDLCDVGDLRLRLDGVPVDISSDPPGRIHERIDLTEGLNTLVVDVTDAAGNTATLVLRITLDSTPPLLVVLTPLDNELTNVAVQPVTGSTEPLVRVDVVVKASAGTRTHDLVSGNDGDFQVPVQLFEGIQKLLVTATDGAGNPTHVVLDIILDTSPAEFIIDSPAEDPTYTDQRSYLIVGTQACDCWAMIFIDGVEVVNTGVFSLEVTLDEGMNLVTVRSVDHAGNEFVVVLTFHVDTVPPVLAVDHPMETSLVTNDPTIRFEGSVTGATAVEVVHNGRDLRATLTSGTWEDGEWRFDLELGPADLEQDVVVRARDRVGNEDLWSAHVVLDVVPPTLTVDAIDEGYINRYHFTITGTASGDVVSVTANGVEGTLDNGSFVIIIQYDDIGGRLLVEASDAAGNVASETYSPIVLDTEPPTFKLDYPRTTDKERVTIKGTCSEDTVEVWVDLEQATLEDGRFSFQVDLPRRGRHRFNLSFVDGAGNTAEKTITIDRGEEVPGAVTGLALLGLALVAVVARRGRGPRSGAI